MKQTVKEIQKLSNHQNFFVFVIAVIAMVGLILVLFLTPQVQASDVLFQDGNAGGSGLDGTFTNVGQYFKGDVNNLSKACVQFTSYNSGYDYDIELSVCKGDANPLSLADVNTNLLNCGWSGNTTVFNGNVSLVHVGGGTYCHEFTTPLDITNNDNYYFGWQNYELFGGVYFKTAYNTTGLPGGLLVNEDYHPNTDVVISNHFLYYDDTYSPGTDDYAMYYGVDPLYLYVNSYKRIPFVFDVCEYDNSQDLNYEARLMDGSFSLINNQIQQLDSCSGTGNLSYFTDSFDWEILHVGIYETATTSSSIVDSESFDVISTSGSQSVPGGEFVQVLFNSPLEVDRSVYATTTLPFSFSFCDSAYFDNLTNPNLCVENYETETKLDYCVDLDSCFGYVEVVDFPVATSTDLLSPYMKFNLYDIATSTVKVFESSDIFQILTYVPISTSTTATSTALELSENDNWFVRKIKGFINQILNVPPFSFLNNFINAFEERADYWENEIISWFIIPVVYADTHYMGSMEVPMDGAGFEIELPFDYLDTEGDISFTILNESDLVGLVGQITIDMFRLLTSILLYSFLFIYLINRLRLFRTF